MRFLTRRGTTALLVSAVVGLTLVGCASTGAGGLAAPAAAKTAPGVVTVGGSLTDHAAALLEKSWAGWEKANHITIQYTGSANFSEQIGGEVQQGNGPDLGIFEQPGLVQDLATRGYVQKLPQAVNSEVKANFSTLWASYTTIDDVDYAAPLLATLNGWVFYSPSQFAKWGVTPPTTWAQLTALTSMIEAKTSAAPWCDGFNADSSSGAAGAAWIADIVLRQDGKDVYDDWVDHKIPFSDPRIEKAFTTLGGILRDSTLSNAGIGGVASIDTASTADVAAAMESGSCALTHQPSSFVGALTAAGGPSVTVSPTGDLWAFMLPGETNSLAPVTAGGDFVAAFSRDADTVKVQRYLASTDWANTRVALGDATSPDVNVSMGEPSTLLDQQSTVILEQFGRVVRFDGAAVMPGVVGSGTFLTGMVDWIGGKSTAKVAATIDASWPKSN
jgi:alpha-glucoside transport system substrate-binding protein